MRSIAMFVAAMIPFLPSRASAAPQSGPPIEVIYDCFNPFGLNPRSGVIEGSDGDFYGTTINGATNGDGSIFKVTASGVATLLFEFDGTSSGGGANGLIEGSDGVLYGTTRWGGANNLGVVFKIGRDGAGFTVLHDFDDATGKWPLSNVIEGADGLLYGTTSAGGANDLGVVFQIGRDGTFFNVIYTFDGVAGSTPYGLIQASDGRFYGTCEAGGANGMGSLFFLFPQWFGKLLVWTGGCLVNFDGANMGGWPKSNLIEGSDGALYGTTSDGGTSHGSLFKVDKTGSGFTVLKYLDATTGEFAGDGSGLIEGSDGALYGTTQSGGAIGSGTLFRSEKDGSEFTVLSNFDVYGDSGSGACGLIEGSDGWLYGTTLVGFRYGNWTYGTVYRVDRRRAGWTNYGSGLAGDLGIPGFVANGDPGIGGSVSLTVTNSKKSSTGATLFMGTSRASIPLRGGTLLVGDVFFLFTTVITGPQLSITGSLPDDPALAGMVLDLQWLEGDPAAPRGLSFTPGLELVLGW